MNRIREFSDIFLQLHISERTGRGVPKNIGSYDKGIYRFGENTISVIMPFDRVQADAQVNTPVDTQVNGQTPQVNTQVNGLTPQVNTQVNGQAPQVNTQVNGQAPQVDAQVDAQVNCQTPPVNTPVNAQVKQRIKRILALCSTPKSMVEIKEMLKVKDRRTVQKVIAPLLRIGRLAMTIPDKPNSRFQKYVAIK